MTSRLLRPIWYGPEFLHLKFSVLYDQISPSFLLQYSIFPATHLYLRFFNILLHTVLSFTVTRAVTVLYFVLLPTSHCYFG